MSKNNNSYLLKDLLQGDNSINNREDFNSLTYDDLKEALDLIVSNKNLSDKKKKDLILNSWKIYYKKKPPTPEEFLTEKWIGPTALSIYDHVRKIFNEFWNPISPYRHLILSPAIGYGKSTLSTISALYTCVHLQLMKAPKKFFGIAQSSSIVQALISFNLDKAKQLLLQPFNQILLSAPMFKRVRTEEKLVERQKEFPDKIVWTSAGKIGSIQFSNDIHIMTASNPAHILGLSLITAIMSELSFFLDRGISPEVIWRIYNDAKGRVYSRFGHRFFATTIMDSSPNDMEQSPIDKYVFSGEAEKDPLNYVVTGSHWSVFPEKYPIHRKTKKIFYCFRGSGSLPPKIIEKDELNNYTDTEVLKVPIDIKQHFIDDIVKAVKDYGGWPSGSQSKLFTNFTVIDKIFHDNLKNVYTYIYANAEDNPENLIWDQLVNEYFVNIGNNRYEFYRSPNEDRFIHIDQSETGDMTSIVMAHPELMKNGKIVQIIDFSIIINPNKKRINLDAIYEFIIDLAEIGNMKIKKITFDRFQSSATKQRLKRKGFDVDALSVDRDINCYRTLLSWIKNERIKMGKNIIIKNNLKSLIEVKNKNGTKKVEHLKGDIVIDDGGDWATSLMGINAKDGSDGLCGAVWNSIQHFEESAPRYQWDDNIVNSITKTENSILETIQKQYGIISKHN